MLCIDKRMTRLRHDFKNLYFQLGIKPTKGIFRCNSFPTCCQSLRIRKRQKVITGSWPYIGIDYGKAIVADKKLRIVMIGMDAGGIDDASRNFQRRQNEWRCTFENSIESPVSPHPTGTALLLKYLVDDKRPNRFSRQFVFINGVKCSPRNGKMTSSIRGSMCNECVSILSKEINLLEPDIIVTQGSYPREMIKKILKSDYKILEKDGFLIYKSRNSIVLATPHPTRHISWKQGILPKQYCKAIEKVRNSI